MPEAGGGGMSEDVGGVASGRPEDMGDDDDDIGPPLPPNYKVLHLDSLKRANCFMQMGSN